MNDLTPIKMMIAEAGGEFYAVQKNFGAGGDIVLFLDTRNPHATLALFEADIVSVDAIRKHIELKRKQFGVGVEGKNVEEIGVKRKKVRSLAGS